MKFGEYIEWERNKGEPIFQQDGRMIRPISRILTVRWPRGGRVWNWPVAIEVEENGAIQELPIIHVTRWAQLGITLMVTTVSLLLWTTQKRRP
ncbi:MAG: hypothetical protein WAM60_12575 [Candidatus Promineifilaceae bacterium]